MKITRRDFINGVMVGSGAALLSSRAPVSVAQSVPYQVDDDWYGYGGVGDYASSHGNTPEAVNTAHHVRDGAFGGLPGNSAVDEEYDLVIVGGGMAGLGAAWQFKKQAKPGQTCLLLDNHPLFGGEAKENEFHVDGETLIAPQGANGFFLPPDAADPEQASGDARYYAEFNIPRELPYQPWAEGVQPLNICRDNYGYLHWLIESNTDVGYFHDDGNGGQWARNIWLNDLKNASVTERQWQGLLAWRNSRNDNLHGDAPARWLDSMSYKDYLEKELKLGEEGAAAADLFLASSFGLGSDALSAWVARDVAMPGTLSKAQIEQKMPRRNSFPGDNSGFARYFLKNIIPGAIAGNYEFNDIITGAINFDALDKPRQPIRVRLRSTAVSVEHEGNAAAAGHVKVVYSRDGKTRVIRAGGVVMASGGWMNRFVVRDLPENFRQAYSQFNHAPFLVANVALSNWRFLYRLGVTACRWQDGFGYTCNIRQPMRVGRRQPPLDPDKPVVLTFYVPFHTPGLSVNAQVSKARAELFYTSYTEYEKQIRNQMMKLFSASGFNPDKDIRGIILNRWGHAYVVPTPGFFFDTPERKAPRNIIREGYGRIAFGHSELQGFQHWGPAADEGRRAVRQVLNIV